MEKIFKRITLALPVALIITLLLSLAASAASSVIWQELDDKTITDGTSVYTLFESPYAITESSQLRFVYENSPYGNWNGIYSYEKNGDIIWTDFGNVYVTEAGREMLLSLEEGDAEAYRLYTGYNVYSDVDTETYESLISLNVDALTIDVRELYNCESLEIYGADPTGSMIMPYGALYFINDATYFLSYIDLPNNCFTADGYFSYLKGEVDIYPVGDALTDELAALVDNATPKYPTYEYEADYSYEVDEDAAILTFYVIFSIVMLLCPAVFLIISLALAATRKRRSSRLWLVGALLALLWIATAVVILIIIS